MIKKVSITDPKYPGILKKIPSPPKQLYYLGKWGKELFKKSLAIVGTRRITNYASRAMDQLIPSLVAEKVTIISGFMYGVDSEAHQKCLECGGRTIAVLGSGLNFIYPPENKKLYQQILKTNGLILSEYEPDVKPQLWTFPQRNRIISGLATLGVLIVEAGQKSGSLITAQLARKQKKKLLALPGPITSSVSAGTNMLIKSGQAKMVLSAKDILGFKSPSIPKQPARLDPIEQKICRILEVEPLTIDEISRKINQNIVETSKTLTMISLKGIIKEENGKYYP